MTWMDNDPLLVQKLATILPYLNEQQRRLLLATEARSLGYGGITQVARAAAVSRPTIQHGLHELDHPTTARVRQRRRRAEASRRPRPHAAGGPGGAGRADTRGDPMSPLRWTSKSTNHLAAALTAQGHPISASGGARGCCTRPTIACRPRPRCCKGAAIPTAMPSSTTSTARSRPRPWRGACR